MSGRMMNAVGRMHRLAVPLDLRLRERRDHAGAMAVADPVLAPVEDPLRAVVAQSRARHDVLRVGAGLRLGERVRGERLAAREHREVALLLLGRAEQHDRLGAESAVHRRRARRSTGRGCETAPNTCAYAAGDRPEPAVLRGIEMPRKPVARRAPGSPPRESSPPRRTAPSRSGPRLIRSSAASRRRTVRVSSGSRSSSVAGKGKSSVSWIAPAKMPRTKEGASSSLMAEA